MPDEFVPPPLPPVLPPGAVPPTGPNAGRVLEPPPGRGLTMGVMVTWLIIILGVGWVLGQAYRERQKSVGTLGGAPAARMQETLELVFEGRVIVVMKTALADEKHASASSINKRLSDLEAPGHIKTTSGEIRLAILAGEVHGSQAAIFRLDSLLAQPNLSPMERESGETLRKLYDEGPAALSAGQRQQLIDRLDWLGHLALSQGQPATSPERRAVILPAIRRMVITTAAIVGALGAGGAGLVLL